MAQVSIGQVENLSDAMAALELCLEQAGAECAERAALVDQKLAESEAALTESEKALETARNARQEASAAVDQAESDLETAESALSDAQAELSSCETGGEYNEDGDFIPPDCSGEEAELADAEVEADHARDSLDRTRQQLEEAKQQCILAEQKVELAKQNHLQAARLAEQVKTECNTRLRVLESLVSGGKMRLANAQEALNAYLAANHEAKAFCDWLKWQPPANKPVTPADIHNRLNLSPAQQRMLLQYLVDRDPEFRNKIAGYRQALDAANGEAERNAVLARMRSNLSGEYAEKFVAKALGVLGTDVKVHVKHDLKSGSYTFTDIVITGLKEPVILGRGEGMMAPKGGSLAIEIKTGKADYLKKQKEHMEKQAEGHQDSDASMTLCTRDINDLSPEEQEALREALRKAGSPLIGMLPRKDEIDGILWGAIKGGGDAG